jgi:hypothetical protein
MHHAESDLKRMIILMFAFISIIRATFDKRKTTYQ